MKDFGGKVYLTSREEQKLHEHYMRMAISFALRGNGSVSPNPRVGCVIVDHRVEGGRLVSWGYHRRYGGPHAEVEALRKAGSEARGNTVYVNMEPCCHSGKTPPCCDALIDAGVARVVCGMADPNPAVNGGGRRALEDAGIEVLDGVLTDECKWINRGFIRSMTMGRPWVTVKAAVSLDGDIAISTGESKWISGPMSRKRAHLLRSANDAVMVGVGTVLADDPELSVRDVDGKTPIKVVVDKNLETPPDARILEKGGVVFFTGACPDEDRVALLADRGAKVIRAEENKEGHIPIDDMLRNLKALGVNSLLVEGGSSLISSFMASCLVDEYSLFIAPKLLGAGIRLSGELSFGHLGEAIAMRSLRLRQLGEDIWFEGLPSCSPDL